MEEKPVARVAQTCRAAAIEMPRPTVRRWCEHGYNVAFEKTVKDLKTHFRSDVPPPQKAPVVEEKRHEEPAPRVVEETRRTPEVVADREPEPEARSALRGGSGASSGSRNIAATIPITIGEETKDLIVYEGQNAEEAVVVFCRENVPDDVSSCIRQLVSTVIEKLEEGANSGV